MESVTLLKRWTGEYWVNGAHLNITRMHRIPGSNRMKPGWRITTHRRSSAWAERNHQLFSIIFPRLRDARAYLDALLANDPLPEDMRVESAGASARLKREKPGRYTVIAKEGAATLQGTLRKGPRHWILTDMTGFPVRQYRSLREAGEQAGHDMRTCVTKNWTQKT